MTTASLIFLIFLVFFITSGHAFTPSHHRKSHQHASAKRFCISLASTSNTLAETMKLNDRFDRWRFLQHLLEGDVDNKDVNTVLLAVLNNALARERSDEPDGMTDVTPELREKIGNVIITPENPMEKLDSLELLDALIPDHTEDEDASKSLWDTVIEMHGRESVKVNEAGATTEWKLSCIKARVLLHFDFLTEGV
jgi:hypothetical protein